MSSLRELFQTTERASSDTPARARPSSTLASQTFLRETVGGEACRSYVSLSTPAPHAQASGISQHHALSCTFWQLDLTLVLCRGRYS